MKRRNEQGTRQKGGFLSQVRFDAKRAAQAASLSAL
jgi:hypothetical protein